MNTTDTTDTITTPVTILTQAQSSALMGFIIGAIVSTDSYLHVRTHTMEDGSILRDDRRQQPWGPQYGGLTAI